ncbi:hypothetical protein FO519_003019 [Halicephalobus sp. NKZ332]|nr:hypothetical protein FO519_003019 [Halicephalobus sp. NKZ332]
MGEAFSPKDDMLKKRRKYALFGGVTMMYFGSHAILLWRRRSEYRKMNELVPPISYEEFEEKYLLTGKKSIAGQLFSQKPDVRFYFPDGAQTLESRIVESQKKLDHPSEIHLEVNSFPSYRELAFITASIFFGACSVALMKF